MSFPGLYFSAARTVRKDKPKKKTTTTPTTTTPTTTTTTPTTTTTTPTTTTSTTTTLTDSLGNPIRIFGDGFTGVYAVFNGEYVAVSQSTQYDQGIIITNNYTKVDNSSISCTCSVGADRWTVVNGTDFIGRAQTNDYAQLINAGFNDWQGTSIAGTMVTTTTSTTTPTTTTTTPTTTTSTTTHSAYEQLLVSGFDYPDINGTYSRPYGSVWFEPYVKLGANPSEMQFEIDGANWIFDADLAPRYFSSVHSELLGPAECTWYVYAPQTTVGTVVHL